MCRHFGVKLCPRQSLNTSSDFSKASQISHRTRIIARIRAVRTGCRDVPRGPGWVGGYCSKSTLGKDLAACALIWRTPSAKQSKSRGRHAISAKSTRAGRAASEMPSAGTAASAKAIQRHKREWDPQHRRSSCLYSSRLALFCLLSSSSTFRCLSYPQHTPVHLVLQPNLISIGSFISG